jgi:hypothetical protein
MITAAAASPRPMRARISSRHFSHDAEIGGIDQHRDQLAALARPRFVEDDGRQVSYLGADGEAKQYELDSGDAHHQSQRQPIAAHLDEFLAEHGPEGPPGDVHATGSCSCKAMKASSSVG